MTSVRAPLLAASERRSLLNHSTAAGTVLLASYAALSLVVAAAPLALAFAIGHLLGAVTTIVSAGAELAPVLGPLVAVAACLAAIQAASLVNTALERLAERRIDAALKDEVMRRVAELPTLDHVADPALRDDLARFTTGGIAWLNSGVGAGALAQIRELTAHIGLLVGGLLLSMYQWWWGPVAVAVCWVVRHVDSRGFLVFERVLDSHSTDLRHTQQWREFLAGQRYARSIRTFGLTDWLLTRHDASIADYSHCLYRSRRRLRLRATALLAAVAVTGGAVYLAVAEAGLAGVLPTGGLATVLGVAGTMLIAGDTQAAMFIESALPMSSALERLRHATPRTPVSKFAESPDTAFSAPPNVSLRDVYFTYPGSKSPALRGCDLELRPGEVLALVGLNGAGKTTAGHLVSGQYTPDHGDVVVDGLPLTSIDPRSWARTVHTIHQDFARFDMSVLDNVLLAVPDASEDEVRWIAERTTLSHHVARLPHGWNTILGEGYPDGGDFSHGQWQTLALTRALLAASRGTQLLVLDEPTANLDIEAELAHFETLLVNRGSSSVLLISHRFATVRRADRIAVLDAGRVVECGGHHDLLLRGGLYAEMYHTQAEPHLNPEFHPLGSAAQC